MDPIIEGDKVFIHESSNGRLYVYFEEYKNHMYLHIRYWICNKRNGDMWQPGKKGIAIPENKVKPVLAALKMVLEMQAKFSGQQPIAASATAPQQAAAQLRIDTASVYD